MNEEIDWAYISFTKKENMWHTEVTDGETNLLGQGLTPSLALMSLLEYNTPKDKTLLSMKADEKLEQEVIEKDTSKFSGTVEKVELTKRNKDYCQNC